jgi:tRNA dimethylallyltransferase
VPALPPLLVIAGPTATGKTRLSLELAEALGRDGIAVEIVSADSRQVYRGMDIGTAKATTQERARVIHHGLDLVDPDQPFSVAQFVHHASGALAGIADRGALALLVGGTGLYLRAVGSGLATDRLPSDPAVRADVERDLVRDGLGPTAVRLRAMAPVLAASTDLRNPRRVARALEIAILRGDGPRPQPTGYAAPSCWIGLEVLAPVLRERIAVRARAQFDAGLVDEAARLRARFDPSLPAFSAIGYREAFAVLDGTLDREAAIALDATRNAAFARRQRTWFRGEPGIRWVDPDDALPVALAAARTLPEPS